MIIVTTTRPALFGPVYGEVQHPDGETFSTTGDGRLIVRGPRIEGEAPSEVGTYPAGTWVGARAVCDAELELQARVRELEEELEHARAVGPDVTEEELTEQAHAELLLDATGAADRLGPEYLAHVDDRLLWLLNMAAREWGAMGVALAAAHMSDPREVRRSLKADR